MQKNRDRSIWCGGGRGLTQVALENGDAGKGRAIARFGRERSLAMKVSTFSAALGAALLLAGPAANATPSALAKVCAKDVKSVCGDVKPGGSKLAACMKEHFSDLSIDCQIAYVKVAAVGRACKADIKKFCADVKPGKNAEAACLKSHAADLSEGCKDAMAKAGASAK